jgi:hypothetical protein
MQLANVVAVVASAATVTICAKPVAKLGLPAMAVVAVVIVVSAMMIETSLRNRRAAGGEFFATPAGADNHLWAAVLTRILSPDLTVSYCEDGFEIAGILRYPDLRDKIIFTLRVLDIASQIVV